MRKTKDPSLARKNTMKKISTHLIALSLALLGLIHPSVSSPSEGKESRRADEKIPLNPKVKYGKLDNGLTYYIMQNAKPEDKVELRLVVNAGSILEEDNQVGLAHFMEHMNFNGTKNFKKNELVDYLQSVGVKFGAHLNAYTGFDQTVYILPIPSDDEEVLEKGFQILEDWAHNADLSAEEIDKERGVVLEEYRIGLGANKRMLNNYLPKVMYGSKYADRLPIGTKENLESFEHNSLRAFYKDWYRPDLMAVIAVGDIDPARMEEKIKSHFSKIKNPKKPKERKEYQVPNHDETFVAIESDVEAAYSSVSLMYKDPRPVEEVTTTEGYKKMVTIQLFASMLNSRLDELRNSANPPFTYGGGYYGASWSRNKNAFQLYAGVAEEDQLKGLRALLTESQRIKQHGFQEGELERVKKTLLARMEKAFNEKDKSQSGSYADEMIRHFLDKEPAPGIEWEFEKQQKILPQISIEDVNGLIDSFISEKNRVVILTGPEKEGLEKVSEQEVLDLLEETDAIELEPYEDKVIASSLIEKMPSPGKIVSAESNDALDYKVLSLENGMKVTYKKTDFKNDEVIFSGYGYGGTSVYSDEEYEKTNLANRVIASSGVGAFSNIDLKKALAGKVANVSPYIDGTSEGFSGNATPKDLETMFQLIHLYFTSPRKDLDAYNSYVQRLKSQYVNLESNPEYYFYINHGKFMSSNHKRAFHLPTEEEWTNTDYDLILEKYREAFANPGDFKLFFVGNIEEEKFKTLVGTYLASLKGVERKDKVVDIGMRPPEGKHEMVYNKGLDPKSLVRINFSGETKYDANERYYLSSLGEILSIKLIEIMREEKGGVYGVGAQGSMSKIPYEHFSFSISFPCGPENAIELKEAALGELQKIIDNGPESKDLEKIKETQRKELKEKLKRNGYWLNKLEGASFAQTDPRTQGELEQRIEDLAAEDIQNVAAKYLSGDVIVGMLFPEGYELKEAGETGTAEPGE